MSVNNSSLFPCPSEGSRFIVTVEPLKGPADNKPSYLSNPAHTAYPAEMAAEDHDTIECALKILEKYHKTSGEALSHPKRIVDFLRIKFELCEREIFSVVFLNYRMQWIALEELFYGTLIQTNVHPREIVKRALILNAATVILVHNHPSGHAEPSDSDRIVTCEVQKALNLVNMNVLDHIIIGKGTYVSFRECGLL